jgi:hypothetical protein
MGLRSRPLVRETKTLCWRSRRGCTLPRDLGVLGSGVELEIKAGVHFAQESRGLGVWG